MGKPVSVRVRSPVLYGSIVQRLGRSLVRRERRVRFPLGPYLKLGWRNRQSARLKNGVTCGFESRSQHDLLDWEKLVEN